MCSHKKRPREIVHSIFILLPYGHDQYELLKAVIVRQKAPIISFASAQHTYIRLHLIPRVTKPRFSSSGTFILSFRFLCPDGYNITTTFSNPMGAAGSWGPLCCYGFNRPNVLGVNVMLSTTRFLAQRTALSNGGHIMHAGFKWSYISMQQTDWLYSGNNNCACLWLFAVFDSLSLRLTTNILILIHVDNINFCVSATCYEIKTEPNDKS